MVSIAWMCGEERWAWARSIADSADGPSLQGDCGSSVGAADMVPGGIEVL